MKKTVDKEFEYRGFRCKIITIDYGDIMTLNPYHCGYVECRVPYEVSEKLVCHGGITYNDGEVIGFDCNHYGDGGIEVEDIEFCESELKVIVHQLIDFKINGGKE